MAHLLPVPSDSRGQTSKPPPLDIDHWPPFAVTPPSEAPPPLPPKPPPPEGISYLRSPNQLVTQIAHTGHGMLGYNLTTPRLMALPPPIPPRPQQMSSSFKGCIETGASAGQTTITSSVRISSSSSEDGSLLRPSSFSACDEDDIYDSPNQRKSHEALAALLLGTTSSVESRAQPPANKATHPMPSPIDDDLAEALRRSLYPSPSVYPDDEGTSLASAIASIEREEAARAKRRELEDQQLARRLQMEEESGSRASTSATAREPTPSEEGFNGQPEEEQPTQGDPPAYVHSTPVARFPGASANNGATLPGLMVRPSKESSYLHSGKGPIRLVPDFPVGLARTMSTGAIDILPRDSSESQTSAHPEIRVAGSSAAGALTGNGLSGTDPSSASAFNTPDIPAAPVVGLKPTVPVIEADLLKGVSFGFTPPPFAADLNTTPSVFPGVVRLPAPPGAPFHIQAKSWRTLLRLLARLDTVRLEPSIEAMAKVRDEVRLRTVIQFNRVAQSSWRVVIYLTLDQRLPASTQMLHKYTNGDTSTLPFSYSQIKPALVFHNNDVTQFFTVPTTTMSPHPTLPILFSNVAHYLQSALDDSRRPGNDSIGGYRRLSKMVDCYYPDEKRLVESEGSGLQGSGTIRRLFGGLRKPKKDRKRTGGNEDVYDLVTPFRVDEWG